MSSVMRWRDWGIDVQAPGIPRADEIAGLAPLAERDRICQDRNGRWRPAHGWASSDEGAICAYCDELKDVLTLHDRAGR
jgi:hypothetical protein